MKKFLIGDVVEIVNLKDPVESNLNGKIGHVGKITRITKVRGTTWYYLEPKIVGACWTANCFKLIEGVSRPQSSSNLFNIEDL